MPFESVVYMNLEDSRYDIALSFAGEDRDVVLLIARCLDDRGVRVFYDDFERTNLWGADLQEHLTNVYFRWSRYAVIFISKHYKEKKWARHELRAILSRALAEKGAYVLPIRIDDTELDGRLPTVGFLSIDPEAVQKSVAEICARLCEKIGLNPLLRKADRIGSPWSPDGSGEVTVDFTSHNGRYRIGDGVYLFETMWSSAGSDSIHCYNYPDSVHGIALVPKSTDISDVTDAAKLDFSSATRLVHLGQAIVLRNVQWILCGCPRQRHRGRQPRRRRERTDFRLCDPQRRGHGLFHDGGMAADFERCWASCQSI